MRRRIVIVLGLMGLIIVALAIALASVGTQVDKIRLNRSDLELDIGDLQAELDALTQEQDALQTERDALKAQVDAQLETIQQLKAEAERAQAQTPAPTTP